MSNYTSTSASTLIQTTTSSIVTRISTVTATATPFPESDKPVFYVADASIKGACSFLLISIAVTALSFLIYEFIRRKSSLVHIFYPRSKTLPDETPNQPRYLFEWISTAFQIDDSYIVENIGLDAVMFLRFLRMGYIMCLVMSLFIIPILVPLNYYSTSDFSANQVNSSSVILQFGTSSISQLSISNIPDKSYLLWLHCLTTYVVSCMIYFALYHFYENYVKLTTEYLAPKINERKQVSWKRTEALQLRTIFIDSIPPNLQDEKSLLEWFKDLEILGDITMLHMEYDVGGEMYELFAKRDIALRRLEREYLKWAQKIEAEQNPKLIGKVLQSAKNFFTLAPFDAQSLRPKILDIKSGKLVDQIDMLTRKLDNVTEEIRMKRKQFGKGSMLTLDKGSSIPPEARKFFGNVAFLTFDSQRSAQIATQLILHAETGPNQMIIRPAPSPQEVCWADLCRNPAGKHFTRTLSLIATYLLVFMWIIPTSFVSSLVSLQQLSEIPAYQPFVLSVVSNTVLLFFMETVVPPFIIMVMNVIASYILDWLSTFKYLPSKFQMEMQTLSTYFLFLFFNVFFVFALSKTFWSLLTTLSSSPQSWIDMVSQAIPHGATFFVKYIILLLFNFAIELLRPLSLIFHLFRRKSLTPRESHEYDLFNGFLNYGFLYPMNILALILVIVYSILSPLILIPGTIYFGLAWLVYKNQLLFVYVKEYEGFGRHFIMAWKRVLIGVIIFQFSMMTFFSLKSAPFVALFTLPLLPISVHFYLFCTASFEHRTYLVPLEMMKRQNQCKSPRLMDEAEISMTGERIDISVMNLNSPLRSEQSKAERHDQLSNKHEMQHLKPRTQNLITSLAEYHAERYPTTYRNPVLNRNLPNPWLPLSLEPYISALEASRTKLGTQHYESRVSFVDENEVLDINFGEASQRTSSSLYDENEKTYKSISSELNGVSVLRTSVILDDQIDEKQYSPFNQLLNGRKQD